MGGKEPGLSYLIFRCSRRSFGNVRQARIRHTNGRVSQTQDLGQEKKVKEG